MNIEERIEKFNHENAPFYLVAHKDGTYSLLAVGIVAVATGIIVAVKRKKKCAQAE